MKLNYLQRKTSTVFIRVTEKSFNCFLKTNFSVPLSDWNSKLQQSKTDSDLNVRLIELKTLLQNELFRKLNNGKDISLAIVKDTYNSIVNPVIEKEYTLSEYIIVFCNSSSSVHIKNKMLNVKTRVDQLPSVILKDIDFKWMQKFQKFLLSKNYAESVVNKYVFLVAQVLRYAAVNDIAIKQSALVVKSLKESTISHYLNNGEIERIFSQVK